MNSTQYLDYQSGIKAKKLEKKMQDTFQAEIKGEWFPHLDARDNLLDIEGDFTSPKGVFLVKIYEKGYEIFELKIKRNK